MSSNRVDEGTVRSAVELATRAPSVHNSQPWCWHLAEHSLHLYADLNRWLPATDPDGRDLVVSCGAALHHVRLALASAGVRATVHRLPNPDDPTHLAAVEFRSGRPSEADALRACLIPRRRSDRRPYQNWPVPPAFLDALRASATAEGGVVRVVTGARAHVVAAARDAASFQDDSAGYATELSLWSSRHASTDGIPPANLPRATLAGVTGNREFSPGTLEVLDDSPDGAELLVIGTASDDPLSQLRAGEALSALLLTATELDLASCPLTQPLEVESARHLLRDELLDTTLCPHVIVRVGWPPTGPPLPTTPRRLAAELTERFE
jgi:nitroreductase